METTSSSKSSFMQKVKRIFIKFLLIFFLLIIGYVSFVYYVPYSTGVRSGELIKFSKRGVLFKTWEGEVSQGISGAQIFVFSVSSSEKEVVENLEKLQGKYVKMHYLERYKTFFWWGDSTYFITKVEEDSTPYMRVKETAK
jgi:hypothetical protein